MTFSLSLSLLCLQGAIKIAASIESVLEKLTKVKLNPTLRRKAYGVRTEQKKRERKRETNRTEQNVRLSMERSSNSKAYFSLPHTHFQ